MDWGKRKTLGLALFRITWITCVISFLSMLWVLFHFFDLKAGATVFLARIWFFGPVISLILAVSLLILNYPKKKHLILIIVVNILLSVLLVLVLILFVTVLVHVLEGFHSFGTFR